VYPRKLTTLLRRANRQRRAISGLMHRTKPEYKKRPDNAFIGRIERASASSVITSLTSGLAWREKKIEISSRKHLACEQEGRPDFASASLEMYIKRDAIALPPARPGQSAAKRRRLARSVFSGRAATALSSRICFSNSVVLA
jgi:hypothetical protein